MPTSNGKDVSPETLPWHEWSLLLNWIDKDNMCDDESEVPELSEFKVRTFCIICYFASRTEKPPAQPGSKVHVRGPLINEGFANYVEGTVVDVKPAGTFQRRRAHVNLKDFDLVYVEYKEQWDAERHNRVVKRGFSPQFGEIRLAHSYFPRMPKSYLVSFVMHVRNLLAVLLLWCR